MSFQFRNAPWTLVLAKFANATGLELRMQALPDGTFNRWDSARYTPSQTLAILNLELAKKPVRCLEYIAVHELVHLLERNHTDRFSALMDRFLPQWRLCRAELNRAPLGHETWSY